MDIKLSSFQQQQKVVNKNIRFAKDNKTFNFGNLSWSEWSASAALIS